jgi:hypothetical protein
VKEARQSSVVKSTQRFWYLTQSHHQAVKLKTFWVEPINKTRIPIANFSSKEKDMLSIKLWAGASLLN